MEFITTLVFIVVVIASLAQKFQETRKANDARQMQKNKSKPGEVRPSIRQELLEGSASVNVAKARDAVGRVTKAGASGETMGRELVEALFDQDSADSDDGWEEIHPEHLPVPKRTVQDMPHQQQPEDPRKAALRQREKMEHDRTRAHSLHGAHSGRQPSRAQMNRAKAQEEKNRAQVLAERQRRKEQANEQKRQASQARRSKQVRGRGIVAPVARGGLIPRNLVEVRRAIVMAEILGRSKAFE